MSIDTQAAFDLDNLPLDVFELADRSVEVESLTTGHGLPEMGASSSTGISSASTSCTGD